MSAFISGGGFEFSLNSVGGLWKWKVTANNVANSGQYFYIDDVNTPFGPLDVVASPIPGDVIDAMSSSLNTFKTQLTPILFLTSPASVNFTVSEGDSINEIGLVTFTNTGALGSFLSVSATPSFSWLLASPTSILGVGKNEIRSTNVRVNPANLLASNSPYAGVVNLQDINNPLTVVPVTYSITVLPRPTIGSNITTINFTYNISTNAGSAPVVATISNTGPLTSILNVFLSKIQNNSPWLSFTPSTLGPLASGGSSTVTFTLVTNSVTKIPGTYTETISVSSVNATNTPLILTVNVVVTA